MTCCLNTHSVSNVFMCFQEYASWKKPCYPPTINKHALKRETSKQGSHFFSLSLSIPSHIQLHCSPSAYNSVDKPPLGHAQKERGSGKVGCGKKRERYNSLVYLYLSIKMHWHSSLSFLFVVCLSSVWVDKGHFRSCSVENKEVFVTSSLFGPGF